MQARLEALPPGERLAVQRASVIGRVFWDDAVESLRLAGDPSLNQVDVPTDDALARLRGRDLVYQREKSAFDHTARVPVQARLARATWRTRGCCGAIAGTTTGSPATGSSGWPRARSAPTSTPG